MDEEKKQAEEALQILASICKNNIVCETCPLFETVCGGESWGLNSQLPYDWLGRR